MFTTDIRDKNGDGLHSTLLDDLSRSLFSGFHKYHIHQPFAIDVPKHPVTPNATATATNRKAPGAAAT